MEVRYLDVLNALRQLVQLAQMPGSHRDKFCCADLVGQDELFAVQGALARIIEDLANTLGQQDWVCQELPELFRRKEPERTYVGPVVPEPEDELAAEIQSALEELGFHPWHTGGGCWAMGATCGTHSILVTNGDACLPNGTDTTYMGVYREDDDEAIEDDFVEGQLGLDEIVAHAKRLVAKYGGVDSPGVE